MRLDDVIRAALADIDDPRPKMLAERRAERLEPARPARRGRRCPILRRVA